MSRIPEPEGWMKNPDIGIDGRSYHSVEALRQADDEYMQRMLQKIEKPVVFDPPINSSRFMMEPPIDKGLIGMITDQKGLIQQFPKPAEC